MFFRTFKKHGLLLLTLALLLLGAFLRLYQISGQILGDDEWHAIRYAIHRDFSYIFTHFSQADNCIPMTLYYKALIETIGLSELGVHSLQIISGLASLILFPLLIRGFFKTRETLIFLYLLAIAPFLIYYCRFGRPYMIVTLLCFIGVFSFYHWITKKKTRYAIIYVFACILVPYFNMSATAAVTGPLIFCFLARLLGKRTPPKLFTLSFISLLILLGIALWFVPAFDSFEKISEKIDRGFVNVKTLVNAQLLFCGTRHYFIMGLLTGFGVLGMVVCIIRNRFLGLYLLFVLLIQYGLVCLTRPASNQHPHIFGRYMISILPLWLVFMAIGLNSAAVLFEKKIKVVNLVLALFLILLFWTGPLPNIYRMVNNLSNHGDYQYRYDGMDFDPHMDLKGKIPEFYAQLREMDDDVSIIETPSLVQWPVIFYHVYQRVHHKRMFMGHNQNAYLSSTKSLIHTNARFFNLINIDNPAAIEESGADFIIIHKNLLDEFLFFKEKFTGRDPSVLSVRANYENVNSIRGSAWRREAQETANRLRRKYGSPVYDKNKRMYVRYKPHYEDEWLVVFKVNQG